MTRETEETVHQFGKTVDKAEKYKWTIVDEPGEFRFIDKRELQIDTSYQRRQILAKVQKIASSWSWQACGCILVAQRDASLFVFDGGHRVEAAMRLSKVQKLPCLVFQTEGAKEEAESFVRVARERRPITSYERFKAEVVAGNPAALTVEKLALEAGRIVSSTAGPATIKCVASLEHLVQTSEETLVKLWPLICQLTQGQVMHEIIVQGLCYIEQNARNNVSLLDPNVKARVLRAGAEFLLLKARSQSALEGKGGARIWALGMLGPLNKGVASKNIDSRIEI